MLADENSFCGDIVLDSFNMTYIGENSIIKQKYGRQIIWDLYYEDLEFFEINGTA